MNKTALQKLYKKRKLHYQLFGESMVDRAMKFYDLQNGQVGCHKFVASEIRIRNTEAWELIRIGLWRRKNGWKRKVING